MLRTFAPEPLSVEAIPALNVSPKTDRAIRAKLCGLFLVYSETQPSRLQPLRSPKQFIAPTDWIAKSLSYTPSVCVSVLIDNGARHG